MFQIIVLINSITIYTCILAPCPSSKEFCLSRASYTELSNC